MYVCRTKISSNHRRTEKWKNSSCVISSDCIIELIIIILYLLFICLSMCISTKKQKIVRFFFSLYFFIFIRGLIFSLLSFHAFFRSKKSVSSIKCLWFRTVDPKTLDGYFIINMIPRVLKRIIQLESSFPGMHSRARP